jgi:hypothetical protein
MATTKKMLQAAAGNAGGGTIEPVSVDFDGTNDYLSRSTDLVGNTDSKTFTFSCWFYILGGNSGVIYSTGSLTDFFDVTFRDADGLYIIGKAADDLNLLFYVDDTAGVGTSKLENTFSHLLVSIDLANTSNRYVYVNDVDVTSGVTWTIYSNVALSLTNTQHRIGNTGGSNNGLFEGRLSNVFLDYTYRDLSVEANRRLFTTIDPDLGLVPAADQASLSPILYVPMDDPADPGRNDGTGGDFTLNGTVARSGRGPNQYNAVASTFDGSADYLSGAVSSSLSDNKLMTCSFAFKALETSTGQIFELEGATDRIVTAYRSGTRLAILVGNASGNLYYLMYEMVAFKTYSVQATFDLDVEANCKVYLNGVLGTSVSSGTFVSADMSWSTAGSIGVASTYTGSNIYNVAIGELWVSNEYVDLATYNPFYDADTNKPKYLGANGELPTGSSPLIYLPLRADDAGNNLGTGGDFTVNSGPFTGARGASEFIARSVNLVTDLTSYLQGGSGGADSKFMTLMLTGVQPNKTNDRFIIKSEPGSRGLDVFKFSTQPMQIAGDPSRFRLEVPDSDFTEGESYTILVCVDLNNTSNRSYFVNGVQGGDQGFVLYNNTAISYASVTDYFIGGGELTNDTHSGNYGAMYLSNEYVDFSQEANRLKFVDALGYPVDLQPAIDAGDIPTPLIHMKFDDTSALGTNSGSGGDFTVNGTVTAGADVKG